MILISILHLCLHYIDIYKLLYLRRFKSALLGLYIYRPLAYIYYLFQYIMLSL